MAYYLKCKNKNCHLFTCNATVYVKNKNKTVTFPIKQSFSGTIYNHAIHYRETQRGIILEI